MKMSEININIPDNLCRQSTVPECFSCRPPTVCSTVHPILSRHRTVDSMSPYINYKINFRSIAHSRKLNMLSHVKFSPTYVSSIIMSQTWLKSVTVL
ncbi:hypothetical protein GDO81_020699 [Engystomops pustulosus]|uniref:Uncharacterized protein n=1 Tax=Engystomops pustulosus TaxID=76066 RepID=A0AAV6YX86_ENGPU|nr:hypothetical protein GDO81_020699 [Engystomops pustulosus]